MKKILSLLAYITLIFLFISCGPGYVEDEPTYVETYRPVQPAPDYIWVNDNWVWRNQTYVHRNGYWSRPKPNRVYVDGHWKREPRGHRWVRGRWNRN
jgi:hypothetical protein